MNKGVKNFVRRILAVHLLLLALLLAVVTLAARHVYTSARDQATNQARANQTRLAEQTAHGVEGFYNSILSDLNLLKPDDEQESDLPDLPTQPAQPKPFASLGVVRQAQGAMLAHQLEGRAYLFLVDEQLRPHTLGAEERIARILNNAATGVRPSSATTAPSPYFEEEIIATYGPWLKLLKEASISEMELIDDRSIKLVATPLIGTQKLTGATGSRFVTRRAGWLVAAVSAKPIETEFLADLGHNGVSGAFLVDETMTIMAASNHKLVGTNLERKTGPELHQALTSLSRHFDGTTSLSHSFFIADEKFDPAMLSVCPVKVMGKQWFVMLSSPLRDDDQVVRDLSRKALFWAIFVAVSMTAILVSTAGQLIFSRLKMERVRHQSLQNEMRQARQIQLAWLPQKTKALSSGALVDIATLNRPATHISGDFYNFFELPNGRTAVVIGDVTGHGTAAAFLMATTQLLIRNTLPQYCDPGRCLDDVNHQLTNQVFNGQFVTMQILVIDPRTGEVAIATAGHPAPLINDGEAFHSLTLEPQLVAGVDPGMQYPTERFHLRPGSSILLYTDGVVDAEDPAGNYLRLDGFKRALTGRVDTAETLLQRAVTAVNTFRRGRDLRDDMTMVAVYLLPQARGITGKPVPEKASPVVGV